MGQQFRAAREAKNITVSRAAAMTHIKTQHIELMERDDFSTMPAPTYAKGFIRIYADFLGLDSVPMVQEYVERHLPGGGGHATPPARTRILDAAPALLEQDAPGPAGAASAASAKPRPRIPRPRIPLPDLTALRRTFATLGKTAYAWWPRIAAAAVLLMVTVGLARCVMHSSLERPGRETDGRMNTEAMMREPPVRYLELPRVENE